MPTLRRAKRKEIRFTYAAQSASSLLVSGKRAYLLKAYPAVISKMNSENLEIFTVFLFFIAFLTTFYQKVVNSQPSPNHHSNNFISSLKQLVTTSVTTPTHFYASKWLEWRMEQ